MTEQQRAEAERDAAIADVYEVTTRLDLALAEVVELRAVIMEAWRAVKEAEAIEAWKAGVEATIHALEATAERLEKADD